MSNDPKEFELSTLQTILEQLHDAAVDYQPETVDRMNEIKEIAWDYFRSGKLSTQQWESVRTLLSHPKAMVRVWVAGEFLYIGSTDVWPLLLKEAEPTPPRADQSRDDKMRDANANNFAWGLANSAQRQYPHLDLRPTFEEIKAQWTAEGKC